MSVNLGESSLQAPLTELCDFLGIELDTLVEMVVEPWGVSIVQYLVDPDGRRFHDEAGNTVCERVHFPATPVFVDPTRRPAQRTTKTVST